VKKWQSKIARMLIVGLMAQFILSSYILADSVTDRINEDPIYERQSSPFDSVMGYFSGENEGDEDLFGILNQREKNQMEQMFDKTIGGAIIGFTDAMLMALNALGLNLDRIIFGRVGAGGDPVITSFAFADGNPLGMMGRMFYMVMAGICIVFYPAILVFYGLKLAVSFTPKGREEAKSALGVWIISLLTIFLIPTIFEIVLYIRDVILSAVLSGGQLLTPEGTTSIIREFRAAALEPATMANQSIVWNGFIYLGSVLMTLYFAVTYVGIGMAIFAIFIMMPWLSLLHISPKRRDLLLKASNELFSLLLVPVIDSVLLFVAIFTMAMNLGALYTLLIICFIAPTRALIRKIMGVSPSIGMELAGVGMMFGAMRILGGAVGATKTAISDIKEGRAGAEADRNEGDFYADMASKDGSIGGGAYGGSSQGRDGAFRGYSGAPDGNNPEFANNYSDVVERHATDAWLDNPNKARMLSNEQKAKLYRARADKRAREGQRRGMMGLAGGAFGAGLGASGAIFGPMGMAAGSGIGIMGGIAAGRGIASMGEVGDIALSGLGSSNKEESHQGSSFYQEHSGSGVDASGGSAMILVGEQGMRSGSVFDTQSIDFEQDKGFFEENVGAIQSMAFDLSTSPKFNDNFDSLGRMGMNKYEENFIEKMTAEANTAGTTAGISPVEVRRELSSIARSSSGYQKAGIEAKRAYMVDALLKKSQSEFNISSDSPQMQNIRENVEKWSGSWAEKMLKNTMENKTNQNFNF